MHFYLPMLLNSVKSLVNQKVIAKEAILKIILSVILRETPITLTGETGEKLGFGVTLTC
jgi:hypothetical protein